jgi:hypothetical protein
MYLIRSGKNILNMLTAISFVLFAYNPLPDFYCFKMEHLTVPVSFLFHAPSYLIPSSI